MDTLNRRQRKAIEALSQGYTRAKSAEYAGVAESTLYIWLRDHDLFKVELSRARDAMFRAGVTQLNGYLEGAIDTLRRAQEGEKISPVQIRAANYLLSHGKAYTELAHFGERLEYALSEIEKIKALYETESNQHTITKPRAKLLTEKSR